MKPALFALCICICLNTRSQNNPPKLEAYVAPGFFMEQLSRDSLIPPKRQNKSRLGDVTSCGMQLALPLKNQRWIAKGGIGFSQRHYSLNKYSLDDVIVSLFLFDSRLRGDSFSISYVRFTNNYLQTPFSFGYTFSNPHHNFKLAAGVNLRGDFLLNSKAHVDFDSAYTIPSPSDIGMAQKTYTAHCAKFVFTAEPYLEGSFAMYKKFGAFIQFRPFSVYSSKLDSHLTVSTVELFSFTFGAFYSFK